MVSTHLPIKDVYTERTGVIFMQKYFPDEMIGNKYGKLTVISIEKQNNKTLLKCKCDCGNEIIRPTYLIATNQIKSCGCLKSEHIKQYNASGKRSKGCYKDGRTLHPLYGTWFQMITRCENPNSKHYDRYGGRGIKVCEEWHDFWKFTEWSNSVGGRPRGYTLDRINNDGNYEPSNCRWANWRTQKTNTSSNVFLEYNGVRKTMIEWCEELNIHPHTLQNRIKRGWSIEKALIHKPKVICQYDTLGNLIAKYNSFSDLPSTFNRKCISDCINGRRKTNKGYIWKYEGE